MAEDDLQRRIQELRQELQTIGQRVQELALRFESEVGRRQAETGATRDVLSDIKDAIDKIGDDLQRLADKIYTVEKEVHRHAGSIEDVRKEVADWKKVAMAEHLLLHKRISSSIEKAQLGDASLRKEIHKAVGESENRTRTFLRDYLPYIVMGILALAGFLTVRSP